MQADGAKWMFLVYYQLIIPVCFGAVVQSLKLFLWPIRRRHLRIRAMLPVGMIPPIDSPEGLKIRETQ
jgi:hypothetical protein